MDRRVARPQPPDVDLGNRGSVARFSKSLLARMSRDEVVERLLALAAPGGDPPPPALLLEIIRLAGVDAVDDLLGAERVRALQVGRSVREILASPRDPAVGARSLGSMTIPEIDLGAALSPPPAVLPIDRCDVDSLDVRSFWESPIFATDPRLRAVLDRLSFEDSAFRERAWHIERLTSFQEYALKHRTLHVNDIYTGEPARYAGCYTQWDKFVYRFDGLHTQYLVCGLTMGRVEGIYLPRENLVLTVNAERSVDTKSWSIVLARMARALLVADASPSGERDPQVTARVGGAENFAHHLWNYYGGVERALRLGSLGNAQSIDVVGTEFFGPVEDVFPEVRELPVRKLKSSMVDASGVNAPDRVTVPLGTGLLFPDVMQRVVDVAEGRTPGPEARAVLERMVRYPRRIYVSLRVGDKSWVDAGQELPRFIDRVLADHPDTCFLLDGYAYPSGADHVSTRWAGQIHELTSLAGTVRDESGHPGQVFSAVGMGMLDSIALMRACTYYITPVGSAHHKVDWLHDLPGIVYVSPDFARGPRESWPGMRQRLGTAPPPEVIVGEETDGTDVRMRGSSDGRTRLSNISMSADALWAAVGTALRDTARQPEEEEPDMDATTTPEPLRNSGVLRTVHAKLRPRTYLEVGVRNGCSLALSSARSIGIDPVPNITSAIRCEYQFVQATSDDYFRTTDPRDYLGSTIDFALVDGLHHFEYALRDFINVEKYCSWSSVVVIDDVLPRTEKEGSRIHEPGPWAGDVFWLPYFLRKYRPDLVVAELDTQPTGVAVVTGLDPASRVLEESYDQIMDEFRRLSADGVPDWVLSRSRALDAREALARMPWELLREGDAAEDGQGRASLDELRSALSELAAPAGSR